jgi:hypothetical protein
MFRRCMSAIFGLAKRILMKLCVCYVISVELSESREWIPSVFSQSKEPSVIRIYDIAYAQYYQGPLGSLKMA